MSEGFQPGNGDGSEFWNSVQHAARQEVVRGAAQLFRAQVVGYVGTKVNIRREYNPAPDGVPYPLLDALVRPAVGQYVWCLDKVGGVVVLGRNLDASDKLAAYATTASVNDRIAAPQTNDVEGNTRPSAYPRASTSVKIRGSGTGFPTPSGTLVTFGAHHPSTVFTSQIWFPNNGLPPSTRSATADDSWTPWVSVAPPPPEGKQILRDNSSVFTANFNIFRAYRQFLFPNGLNMIDVRVEAKMDLIRTARVGLVSNTPNSNNIYPAVKRLVDGSWTESQVYIDITDNVLRVDKYTGAGEVLDISISWVT